MAGKWIEEINRMHGKSMKYLISELASMDLVMLPGLSPRDFKIRWSNAIDETVQCRDR